MESNLKVIIKNNVPKQKLHILKKIYYFLAISFEKIIYGSSIRATILVALLKNYYKSKIRRDWSLTLESPHFTDQFARFFLFAFDDKNNNPLIFYRAFYSSEVIKASQRVLDIGCGDGFITKKFLSFNASHVDAVDIEPDAISTASKVNADPKINYILSDAVNEDFPSKDYDVIVWDGAIGHFAQDTTQKMLSKIKNSMTEKGIFCGSESLGEEGSDHLQFFYSLEDFVNMLKPNFKYIQVKKIEYPINNGTYLRSEALWRCSNSKESLQSIGWELYES